MTYDHHSTQVEYNGTTYYGHNAVITSTQLGHSHNLPTLSIHTKWGGGGGGIGPLILADYDSDSLTIRPFSFGIALLMEILKVVGVENWEELPDKNVVVLYDTQHSLGSLSVGISNILDGKNTLIFRDFRDKYFADILDPAVELYPLRFSK